MVYNKISIHPSKSIKGKNMGEFYGTILGNIIKCSRVDFR
jgi:hypothetical protein